MAGSAEALEKFQRRTAIPLFNLALARPRIGGEGGPLPAGSGHSSNLPERQSPDQ